MKLIDKEGAEANWENAILKDLVFIKKHLRFPVSLKTLTPTLLISTGLFIGLQLTITAVEFKKNSLVSIFLLLMVTIAVVASALKFVRSLRFWKIHSPYFLNENIKAIELFLKAQQIAFSQHPGAPEVFCIISRNIGNSGDKREIMFFIAVDKQILVNSHYTGSSFMINRQSGHARQMARSLQKWLGAYNAPVDSAITSFNSN